MIMKLCMYRYTFMSRCFTSFIICSNHYQLCQVDAPMQDKSIFFPFLLLFQHTMKIILSDNPPFRHQTNTLYTPMTTLKYADPNGDLPIDTFYKMVFQHDKVFNASLNFIKLLRWRSKKSFDLGKNQS